MTSGDIGIRLLHRHGSLSGTTSIVPSGVANLGRKAGVEIVLDAKHDFLVSGLHARLFRDSAMAWHLEDLGSTNGTFVDGRPLQGRQQLRTGHVVTLGSAGQADGAVVFEIAIEGEEQAAQAAATLPSVEAAAKPASAAPPVESGGLFGKLKHKFHRFMDKRELLRQLDDEHARLPPRRAAAESACGELGVQAWHRDSIECDELDGAAGLQDYRQAVGALDAELAAARDRMAEARQAFASDAEHDRARHEQLQALAEDKAAGAAALEKEASAADDAIAADLRDRFEALTRTGEAIVALRARYGDPTAELERDLRGLCEQLQSTHDLCATPLDRFADRIASRDALREQAAAARSESDAAIDEVNASIATQEQRARELSAQEAELQRQESEHDAGVAKQRQAHRAAFAALGLEAMTKGLQRIESLPAFAQASQARSELLALEERIAAGKARLAELDA